MTDKEALKLALEFIERVNKDGWILADFEPQMYATITAIKDALAQRTWVGLTDREMMKAIHMDDSPMEMGRKIESKLQELNHAK